MVTDPRTLALSAWCACTDTRGNRVGGLHSAIQVLGSRSRLSYAMHDFATAYRERDAAALLLHVADRLRIIFRED